jgi:hypothetical protein|tara:strand:+ start:1849 stop:2073 length:225 start_codon:yes stop_codon:yes gene_type:complete
MNTITKEKEAELAEMIDREKARIIEEMEKVCALLDTAKTAGGIKAHAAAGRAFILRSKVIEIRREIEEKLGVSS